MRHCCGIAIESRKSVVDEEYFTVGVKFVEAKEEVRGFDVPVDDVMRVHVFDGFDLCCIGR